MIESELSERIQKGLVYFWSLSPSKWTPKDHSWHIEFLRLIDLHLNGIHTITTPTPPGSVVGTIKVEQMDTEAVKSIFQ